MKQGLVKDTSTKREYPRNFRDLIKLDASTLTCNTDGLSKLRCMASGQYNQTQFQLVTEGYHKADIVVFDLRKESHFFFDGKPFSWYAKENYANKGKTRREALLDEKIRAQTYAECRALMYYKEKDLDKVNPPESTEWVYKQACTEEAFITQQGCQYNRFPILDHHRPDDKLVDRFIKAFANRTDKTIFYFHCKGGMGRASTFMSMYDILSNPHISLEDILTRQALMGGRDLKDKAHYDKKGSERVTLAKIRYEFIRNFHQYVTSGAKDKQSWKEYAANLTHTVPASEILQQYELQKRAVQTNTNNTANEQTEVKVKFG